MLLIIVTQNPNIGHSLGKGASNHRNPNASCNCLSCYRPILGHILQTLFCCMFYIERKDKFLKELLNAHFRISNGLIIWEWADPVGRLAHLLR